MAKLLNSRERRTVRAFAEVFIASDPAITADEVVDNVDRYLTQVQSSRTASLRLMLFLIEFILPRLWWPLRPSFSKLSPADRQQFVHDKLQNPRLPPFFRDLAKVKSLLAIGYYGDTRVYESIGFTPVEQRPSLAPFLDQPPSLPPLKLAVPDSTELACDVCVIGSGAGGAVVAFNAALQGKDVILLEEGPYARPEEVVNHEATMMPWLYKEGGLQATVDQDMMILQGKVLGGTTVLNNAICFRLNDPGITPDEGPDLLARWGDLGAHLDREGLNHSFDRVEKMIGVRPLLQTQPDGVSGIDGNNARLLLRGWQALVDQDPELSRYQSGLFRKNYKNCFGCGYCNFGCRFERKLGMAETYIPAAIQRGARVITACHAVKIETVGAHAVGVRCEMGNGRSLFVRAKSIVVSCGAIGSSVLLMKSGITRNVGTRFSFNAGLPVFALFPQEVRASEGVQMAAYVDANDYLIESLFYPPMALAAPLPGWFDVHHQRMKAYARLACAGVLVGTEANGRVKRHGWQRKLFGPVDYQMTAVDLQKIKRGITRAAEIFFAAGAEQVFPASFAPCTMTAPDFAGQPAKIQAFIDAQIRRQDDLTLGSAHPQGGNPMSDNRHLGAINSQFRVHDYANLFVCDASIFPTTIRINPQLTIMAMADYFANLGTL